jgi:aminoglycoside phosphotransferase (APT) family kinase protein
MIPDLVQAAVKVALPQVETTITLREPEAHQSNQLFHVWAGEQHYIAKLYLKEEEWESAPAREHASLQLLKGLEIAPLPYFYDAALGPIVIYHYLEGRIWGRYRPSIDELHQLATAMARLKDVPTQQLWIARGFEMEVAERVAWFHQLLDTYALWAGESFPAGEAIVGQCRQMIARSQKVLKRLAENPFPPIFCRSDPRFANIIVQPNGSYGFVDWEDAGLRDPALEIADTVLHPEQEDLLTSIEWQSFVTAYCDATGFTYEGFAQRVMEYARVFSLFWVLILLRAGVTRSKQGQLAGWTVNEMAANLRLQRYWARARAELMGNGENDPSAYADLHFFPEDRLQA